MFHLAKDCAALEHGGQETTRDPNTNPFGDGFHRRLHEIFSEAVLTLSNHISVIKVIVAPISHVLILGKTWLADTNPSIDWRNMTVHFPKESCKLDSIAQTDEPYELISAKQFDRLLKMDTSSCFVLLLESTEPHIDPTSDDYRSCLPRTLRPRCSVDYHIDVHPESKPLARAPHTDTLIDKTRRSKVFSLIDLWSAYHQVGIYKPDIPKTAFVTPSGHFEYLVVPFGLTNAPSTFQTLMNSLLRHLAFVSVYLDDILIFSKTRNEHADHLRQVPPFRNISSMPSQRDAPSSRTMWNFPAMYWTAMK